MFAYILIRSRNNYSTDCGRFKFLRLSAMSFRNELVCIDKVVCTHELELPTRETAAQPGNFLRSQIDNEPRDFWRLTAMLDLS